MTNYRNANNTRHFDAQLVKYNYYDKSYTQSRIQRP